MTGNNTNFEQAMNDGHSAAWDQNWEQAATCYRQALEEFPKHPVALSNLGLALFEMQSFEQALACYQQAAQVLPDDPLPREKIARIHERLGRLGDAVRESIETAELHLKSRNVEKALENWLRAISMQPDHLDTRVRLAMVYERIGRKEDAVNEYLACASLLQHAGDITKAMQVVSYAVKIHPQNEDAHQALAMLQANQPLPKPTRPRGGTGPVRMAEVRQLEASKKKSAAEKPLDPIAEARQQALVDMAAMLFEPVEDKIDNTQPVRRGISMLARGTGKLTLGRSEQTKVLMHIGQSIESQTHGDDEQALKELERIIDLGFSHPALYFDYGLLCTPGNSQRALRYLQKSVKHPDYALASNLVMAQIYQREGSYPQAANAYLMALSLADAATIEAELADDLRQLYEPIIEEHTREKGEEYLKSLCENIASQLIRSDWRQFLQSARKQLPVQPQGSLPLPLAELLLQTNSSEVVEAMTRVRQLVEERKYRTATEEAFNSMEIAPGYLPLHIQVGDILMRMGNLPDAITKYLTAADLYALRGEAAQAINLLKRVIQAAPMELKMRNRLIELLVANGRVEEALHNYIDLAGAYYHLAELKLARQTYTAALRLIQESKIDRSWSVNILYKIADIDRQSLDLRNALRVFEQIRTLEPEDTEARAQIIDLNFRLGQRNTALNEVDGFTALLEHAGKRDSAIEFIKDLIEEHPNSHDLAKRLADLYLRNHQVDLAVKQLDDIADALLQAGNRNAAIAMLNSIIALNPPNLADYQAALEQLKSG